jgi:hypothetical protein
LPYSLHPSRFRFMTGMSEYMKTACTASYHRHAARTRIVPNGVRTFLRPALREIALSGLRTDLPPSVHMPHAHTVFFQLHDGMVTFSAGTRAAGYNRDVNAVQLAVSLHLIFSDNRKHDACQAAPRHVEFATRNKPLWKSVRVFDSIVPL